MTSARFILASAMVLGSMGMNAQAEGSEGSEGSAKKHKLPPIASSAEETKPIKVGETVADVEVKTLDGKKHRLSGLLEGGPAILIFYRGGWCPYCNAQLGNLKSIEEDLIGMGVRLLAVSPDRPAKAEETKEKEALAYTLISDAPMNAARAFGVAFRVDDETLEVYKGYGIDLKAASGEEHNSLPVPSVFLVDEKRKILFSHANPDYKVRLDNEAILAAARMIAK